jgi:hypothetical protein
MFDKKPKSEAPNTKQIRMPEKVGEKEKGKRRTRQHAQW